MKMKIVNLTVNQIIKCYKHLEGKGGRIKKWQIQIIDTAQIK